MFTDDSLGFNSGIPGGSGGRQNFDQQQQFRPFGSDRPCSALVNVTLFVFVQMRVMSLTICFVFLLAKIGYSESKWRPGDRWAYPNHGRYDGQYLLLFVVYGRVQPATRPLGITNLRVCHPVYTISQHSTKLFILVCVCVVTLRFSSASFQTNAKHCRLFEIGLPVQHQREFHFQHEQHQLDGTGGPEKIRRHERGQGLPLFQQPS